MISKNPTNKAKNIVKKRNFLLFKLETKEIKKIINNKCKVIKKNSKTFIQTSMNIFILTPINKVESIF